MTWSAIEKGWAVMNSFFNLPCIFGHFVTSWSGTDFSKRSLFHGVFFNPCTDLDRPKPRFQDSRHMKVVRLSSLHTSWVNPRAVLQLEELFQSKLQWHYLESTLWTCGLSHSVSTNCATIYPGRLAGRLVRLVVWDGVIGWSGWLVGLVGWLGWVGLVGWLVGWLAG
jgi:hypothetical protein